MSSVNLLDNHPLAEGKCVLAFFPMRPLFWATLLQSQQSFRFPFQRTDELRVSQRATSVGVPANQVQFRFALPGIEILTPGSIRPSPSPHSHRQPSLLRATATVDRSAGPRPALSPVHHTGTPRVQLRIPQRFPQMLLVQRARIVSPLPDMAGCMMACIPIGGIPPLSVLQRQPQTIGLLGHSDHVYMIGHQAVADQFYSVQGNVLLQQIQIDAAVGVAGEDKLPSIPTLGNVMRYPDCDH